MPWNFRRKLTAVTASGDTAADGTPRSPEGHGYTCPAVTELEPFCFLVNIRCA
jgi:hypothetical protein